MEGGIGRRDALRRVFAMVAGLVGLGMTSSVAAVAETGPTHLRLFGVEWRRLSASSDAGKPPVAGERATVHGTLREYPDGREVGEFQAASFFGESRLGEGGSASLEFHTFTLGDDVLFGVGNAAEPSGIFAVVGGSGRYIGARGSYVAHQSPVELGGDGTARFDFTLL